MTPRRRTEDGPRGTAAKITMAIACPLTVAAIIWLFSNVQALLSRTDHIEWWLKYKGLLP